MGQTFKLPVRGGEHFPRCGDMQGETGQACTRGQWNLRLADARHTGAAAFFPPHGGPLLRSNIQGAFAAALGQPAPELEEAASLSRTVQGSAARPLADSSTKVAAEAGEPCAKVLTRRVSATAIFRCRDTQGAGKGGAVVSLFRGWGGKRGRGRQGLVHHVHGQVELRTTQARLRL